MAPPPGRGPVQQRRHHLGDPEDQADRSRRPGEDPYDRGAGPQSLAGQGPRDRRPQARADTGEDVRGTGQRDRVRDAPFPSITASQIEANKAYARVYILNTYGWGDDQWLALEQLWTRESGWNHLAVNPTSGATGIPQALPGDKMATAGSDWKTNPQTQIRWGASYIKGRYKDPLGAWAHFKAKNWY